ncbi:MAG: hypothetical protein Rhims3KO_02680 [Hyphomicrobiales bacterium]
MKTATTTSSKMARLFLTTLAGMLLLAAIIVVFLSGVQGDAFASTQIEGSDTITITAVSGRLCTVDAATVLHPTTGETITARQASC